MGRLEEIEGIDERYKLEEVGILGFVKLFLLVL